MRFYIEEKMKHVQQATSTIATPIVIDTEDTVDGTTKVHND